MRSPLATLGRRLLTLTATMLLLAAGLCSAELLLDQEEAASASERFSRPPAQLISVDERGQPLRLFPGLLDETLLTSGSFSFGAKLVKFDKLKVLGNVYVQRINGRPLREAYLLRSMTGGGRSAAGSKQPGGGGGGGSQTHQSGNDEVRLRIVR